MTAPIMAAAPIMANAPDGEPGQVGALAAGSMAGREDRQDPARCQHPLAGRIQQSWAVRAV